MNEQLILPFRQLAISPLVQRLFHLANASSYITRKGWWYPFKSEFLEQHALPDGYDLQIITRPCWCDKGTWRGRDWELPRRLWQACWQCEGTGIYRTDKIILQRWILGATIYHQPTDLLPTTGLHYKDTITGLVTHPHVPEWKGELACLALLIRYDTPTGLRYLRTLYRQRISNRFYRKLRQFDRWIATSFPPTEDFETDPCPF